MVYVKKFTKIMLLLFLTTSIGISLCSAAISSEDIQASGKSCFPSDTCKIKQVVNCKCDNQCTRYGDCCFDFDFHNSTSQGSKSEFLCQKKSKHSSNGIYVKSMCPSDDVPSWIRTNCEGAPSASDIELKIPVFSLNSSESYKNLYCALCNNDRNNLVFWDVEISCRRYIRKNELKKRLTYNNNTDNWGFWYLLYGRPKWTPCEILPSMPSQISNYRECIISVSECISDWNNNTAYHMCRMYESPLVSKEGKMYKNFHCALCNNANTEDLKCQTVASFDESTGKPHGNRDNTDEMSIKFFLNIYPKAVRPSNVITINFGDLFDFKLHRGNRIVSSGINNCSEGHVYDVVTHKCSKMFCIGNRIIKDGKCVPV